MIYCPVFFSNDENDILLLLVALCLTHNHPCIYTLIGFDCGVFTCMFADFVTKDCEPVFQQEHITQCRQRIALSIMKNCAIE